MRTPMPRLNAPSTVLRVKSKDPFRRVTLSCAAGQLPYSEMARLARALLIASRSPGRSRRPLVKISISSNPCSPAKRTNIKQIHADDVKVYNPDGTITEPMPPHADELQFLFDTFDFRVAKHIVGFGFGEWTAGISISEGKWVKPLTLPDGTVLQPTGKPVSLKIATIARWENGRIAEEYLFWDNADWNQQIGLGQ